MKKLYPYIFPAVALLFVLFLLVRWYNLRTQRGTSLLSESVTVSELADEHSESLLKGVGDFQSADLKDDAGAAMGEVRWEVVDGQLNFSVMTMLPMLTNGHYQVWLRQTESEAQKKAFMLEYGKGGYMGTGAIDAATLPLEVVVSKEATDDGMPETVLLRGTMVNEAQ